jgi:hypothetical protein
MIDLGCLVGRNEASKGCRVELTLTFGPYRLHWAAANWQPIRQYRIVQCQEKPRISTILKAIRKL